MKKISLLMLTLVMACMLTGCGKDKETSATCNYKNEQFDSTVRLSAKNDKIEKVGLTYVYENSALGIESFDNVTDEQKEQIKENMLTILGLTEESYEGFAIDITIEDKMKVNIEIDIATADKDALKKLGIDFSNTDMSLANAVKTYKDQGFTCE